METAATTKEKAVMEDTEIRGEQEIEEAIVGIVEFGVVLKLNDGREFQLTIVESTRGW